MDPVRVLRATKRELSVTFLTGTTPVDADAAVTVDVTRADGSAFDTGAPTTHAGAATGTYSYALDPQATLDLLTLRWQGTFGGEVQAITTQAEIVGGFHFSLPELKAESGMGNKSDAELEAARSWWEDKAERWCGVAFVPRFARETLDGTGSRALRLAHVKPRVILGATIDGVVQSGLATWDLYPDGRIVRDSGHFPSGELNVAISYEHGEDAADADLVEVALTACRARLLGDSSAGGIPAGVTQLVTDAGTYTFGRRTFPTGLPEVDSVLQERRVPMVA